tara:strand:+ start:406 stop:546 length:141 start_codon:yes stop_codon:yes gene_type:complete
MKKKYEGISQEIDRLEAEIKELKGAKGIDKDLVDKLKGSKIYFGGK